MGLLFIWLWPLIAIATKCLRKHLSSYGQLEAGALLGRAESDGGQKGEGARSPPLENEFIHLLSQLKCIYKFYCKQNIYLTMHIFMFE
jgi:hypothetical protein